MHSQQIARQRQRIHQGDNHEDPRIGRDGGGRPVPVRHWPRPGARPGATGRLAHQTAAPAGRVGAWRRHRRHGARRGRQAGAPAQADGRGREQARRVQHTGGGSGREVGGQPHHGDGRVDGPRDCAPSAEAGLRQ
ncbi:hypothetical protein G6F31_019350 [Rhizopus arrhizus]|nr:hypothetical protein G6F31_019350 [Rhizopus arrhizus]